MEEKKKDALRFLMFFPGGHKRETAPGIPAQAGKGRNGGRKWVKPVVFPLIIGAAMAVAMTWRGMKAETVTARTQSHNTASAERRDISSELFSPDTLKVKNTYNITSMVEGEVPSAGFEKGDQMEKGQAPYEINKFSMESQLTSSVNSLTRSQSSYENTLEDHNDALSDYNGSTYKAIDTRYIKRLYISVGDKVSGNTKLADAYSDDIMEIRIPFLSGEAAIVGVGMPAAVTLTNTGEQMAGTVKVVANQETVFMGGRLVWVVTTQVPDPGGLTASLKTTAQIGKFIDSEDGVFEASVDIIMNMDLSTSAEVESLLVNAGDYVTKGTPVFKMTDRLADKLVQSYKDALDKAEKNVESAQSRLNSTQGSYGNHTIKVPIFGQVIIKNFKMGDNITKNSSDTAVLATIHDLSSLTFEASTDKLDIEKVGVGQKVGVSTNAFEGQTFPGTVTNISLESTYSNGVNTYPVIVTLDNMDDLLPGISVGGVITLEEANDVSAIPADTLMRGNQVYVKDDTMTEQQGPVPVGFWAVKVETRLTSDIFVEIKSGLSERDVVYVAESGKNSNSVMMTMDNGMDGSSGEGGDMGDGDHGGPEGGRQNR